MTDVVTIHSYNRLRNDVARVLREGRERAWEAVGRETLKTYYEIGRLLDDHLAASAYGDRTMKRLAEDVGLGRTLLYQIVALYRIKPKFHDHGLLGWGHYRQLVSLREPEARRFYEEAAARFGWSAEELRRQIGSNAFTGAPEEPPTVDRTAVSPLPALRGELYTYRIVPGSDPQDLRLDLGFGIHLSRPLDGLQLRAEDVVHSIRSSAGAYRLAQRDRTRAISYYSFEARVLRLVDADTLFLDIDCGFGVWTRQRVRLRGIDAQELGTPEGTRAKDFVAQRIHAGNRVAVTTTRPDKYDRYLADIFYSLDASPEEMLREGTFLNRELIAAGLAKRYTI